MHRGPSGEPAAIGAMAIMIMPAAIMTIVLARIRSTQFMEFAALVIVICVCRACAWRSGDAFSLLCASGDERRLTL